MKSTRIIIINLFRIVLGLTFILSGFVKAIDPLGTQYKIEDYLGVLSLGGMLPDFVTLGTSVAISAIEFTLGVLLLFAISRRVISKVTLVFMTIMTLITAWLYIANPISDCGCFGDMICSSESSWYFRIPSPFFVSLFNKGIQKILKRWPLTIQLSFFF